VFAVLITALKVVCCISSQVKCLRARLWPPPPSREPNEALLQGRPCPQILDEGASVCRVDYSLKSLMLLLPLVKKLYVRFSKT
jgi:hypothetical protein